MAAPCLIQLKNSLHPLCVPPAQPYLVPRSHLPTGRIHTAVPGAWGRCGTACPCWARPSARCESRQAPHTCTRCHLQHPSCCLPGALSLLLGAAILLGLSQQRAGAAWSFCPVAAHQPRGRSCRCWSCTCRTGGPCWAPPCARSAAAPRSHSCTPRHCHRLEQLQEQPWGSWRS